MTSAASSPPPGRRRVWNFVQEYSLLLLVGAVIALVWANVDYETYHHIIEYNLWTNPIVGHLHDDGAGHVTRDLTVHYLINDLLMALFFAIAGKEVWEALILKNGSLRGKKAVTPLIATAGGVIGPVAVYLLGAMLIGQYTALFEGWAIPTATDIAFAYLVGRVIFGAGHPAIMFLLLLAIVDDAVGLLIIAFYYNDGIQLEWLGLAAAAATSAYLLFNWLPRRMDRGDQARPNSTWVRTKLGFWPYFMFGLISLWAFQQAGVHPALGLLPIIPAMPHADVDFGFFSEEETHKHDVLNDFEHSMKTPVEVILFLFGLANAGVLFSAIGDATWLVLGGLLIGKPVGIYIFGQIAARGMGLGLPDGMNHKDLLVVGFIAAIGFTVALFVAGIAFPAGSDVQAAAKMGALFSFFAAIVAIVVGRALNVGPSDR